MIKRIVICLAVLVSLQIGLSYVSAQTVASPTVANPFSSTSGGASTNIVAETAVIGSASTSGTTSPLTVDNGSSTGAIACFRDNGVSGWCFNDGGQFKWTHNSTGVITSYGGQTLNFTNSGLIELYSPIYGTFRWGSTSTKNQSLEYGIGKTITESIATNVILIGITAGGGGGNFSYSVEADDGTDYQVRAGTVNWQVINKAGTETCIVSGFDGTANPTELKDGSSLAASLGTLTYTWGVDTTVANGCYLTLNATSSLAQTTLRVHGYKIQGWSNSNGGPTTFLFTPQ